MTEEVKPGYWWAKWNGFQSLPTIVFLEESDDSQVQVWGWPENMYFHVSQGPDDDEVGYEFISPIELPEEE